MTHKTSLQRQKEAIERKRIVAENHLSHVVHWRSQAVRFKALRGDKVGDCLARMLMLAVRYYLVSIECGVAHNETVATAAATLTGKSASALFGLPFRAFEEVIQKSKSKTWDQIVSEDQEHLTNVFLQK